MFSRLPSVCVCVRLPVVHTSGVCVGGGGGGGWGCYGRAMVLGNFQFLGSF